MLVCVCVCAFNHDQEYIFHCTVCIVLFTFLFIFWNSATTTVIHRPHGDSMLVIRPSVHKKNRPPSQQFTNNPVIAQASTTSTTTKLPNFTNTVLHLDTAASTSTGKNCAFPLFFCIRILAVWQTKRKKTTKLKCRYRVMTAKCVAFSSLSIADI